SPAVHRLRLHTESFLFARERIFIAWGRSSSRLVLLPPAHKDGLLLHQTRRFPKPILRRNWNGQNVLAAAQCFLVRQSLQLGSILGGQSGFGRFPLLHHDLLLFPRRIFHKKNIPNSALPVTCFPRQFLLSTFAAQHSKFRRWLCLIKSPP